MGFTLMELLVAVGIFALVMTVVAGVVIRLSAAQRVIRDKKDILNELRFAIDLMGQEINSGSAFAIPPTPECYPGSTCTGNSCDTICFATKVRPDIPRRRVEYILDAATGQIRRGEHKTFGLCKTIPLDSKCYSPLTSTRATITRLTFFLGNKGRNLQPIVTIAIQGNIQGEPFDISASYAPRLYQDPGAVPPLDNQNPTVAITSPCDPSYPPSSDCGASAGASVALAGSASDNDVVTEVRWHNETSGANGFSDAFTPASSIFWDISSLPLAGDVKNIIRVEAWDKGGNTISDKITVTSTAPLGNTSLTDAYATCDASNSYIALRWSAVPGATEYEIERCADTCTPAPPPYVTTSSTSFNDSVGHNETYSYRVRACGGISGSCSAYSGVATVQATKAACSSSGNGAGSGSFTLSANPGTISIGVNGDPGTLSSPAATTITVSPLGGFDKDVSINLNGGAPSGSSCYANPGELEDDEYASGSSFSCQVPNSASPGLYTLTVSGSASSGEWANTTVYLDVKSVGGGQQ